MGALLCTGEVVTARLPEDTTTELLGEIAIFGICVGNKDMEDVGDIVTVEDGLTCVAGVGGP